MVAREEIVERLNRVFQEVFDDEALVISPEMTARDVDDWDSVNHITLVVAIEKEFRIKLKMAEVGTLENVGQMIDLLERRVI